MPKPIHDFEPTASWWYTALQEQRDDGWYVSLAGIEPVWSAGPLPSADAARSLLAEQLARWVTRAKAAGGYAAVQFNGVLVTLPRMKGKPRGALPAWSRPKG